MSAFWPDLSTKEGLNASKKQAVIGGGVLVAGYIFTTILLIFGGLPIDTTGLNITAMLFLNIIVVLILGGVTWKVYESFGLVSTSFLALFAVYEFIAKIMYNLPPVIQVIALVLILLGLRGAIYKYNHRNDTIQQTPSASTPTTTTTTTTKTDV